MPDKMPHQRFPTADRPLGALNADLAGIVAYAVIVIPLALLILAVVLLTRPF